MRTRGGLFFPRQWVEIQGSLLLLTFSFFQLSVVSDSSKRLLVCLLNLAVVVSFLHQALTQNMLVFTKVALAPFCLCNEDRTLANGPPRESGMEVMVPGAEAQP